MTHPT